MSSRRRIRRFIASLFSGASFPATVLFALTARPARLYAEVGPYPPVCTAPEVEACSGKSSGDPCSYDAGAGVCGLYFCIANPDAGIGSEIQAETCGPAGPAAPDAGADSADGAGADSARSADSAGEVGVLDDGSPESDGEGVPADGSGGGNVVGAEFILDDGAPAGASEAGPSEALPSSGGGCGCGVAGGPSGAAWMAASSLLVVGAAVGLRRRGPRRKRAQQR